ncbi:MAG: hypothetical protein KC912_14215 [Proteobacteria bacterium]|nr:hypothetical protein [Pseudomonadota bacterium]
MVSLLLVLAMPAHANDGPLLSCDTSVYVDSMFNSGSGDLEDDDCAVYSSSCQQPAGSPSPDRWLQFNTPGDVWVEMNSAIGVGLNMNLYVLYGADPGFGGTCANEIACIDWEFNNGQNNGVYADNWGGEKSVYGGLPDGATVWYGWDLNETQPGDSSLSVDLSCCWDRDGDGTYDIGTENLCPLLEASPDLIDCHDDDPLNFPTNAEVCDGQDNDCDGSVDELLPTFTYFRDVDGDGWGDSASTVTDCGPPAGYVDRGGDCDDNNAARNPGLAETTCNGIDDDCNATTLDRPDGDNDGADACVDCDDSNPLRSPNFNETTCNGIDDDCNAATLDEPDFDGDGSNACLDCNDANANISPLLTEVTCNNIDDDCNATTIDRPDGDADGVDVCTDCDDGDANNYQGNTEICDGQDNDCDTLVDDLDPDVDDTTGAIYYADTDDDTYGDAGNTIESCSVPDGYVTNANDCDDNLAIRNPGETEVCDGIDNDCDPTVDEETECYDDDGDGFTELAGDCDDALNSLNPVMDEICDGIDNDCDTRIDEGTGCVDDDDDGYCEGADIDGDGQADDCRDSSIAGDCNDGDSAVSPGVTEFNGNGVDDDCDGAVDGDAFDADGDGYLVGGGDCGVNDATAYPGAPELADGVDNDCDGTVDEGTDNSDDDGDGSSEAEGDCNDVDADINAGATDVPNSIDDDCDGIVDEGSDNTDDDGDGFSELEGDCNDADPNLYPGADEVLNGVDDNCNDLADEGLNDVDGDGYTEADGDCDDNQGWANPGRDEQCDGLDNDCDGEVDEGTCSTGGDFVPAESGCSCATPGTTPFAWLPLIALVGLRRRETQR